MNKLLISNIIVFGFGMLIVLGSWGMKLDIERLLFERSKQRDIKCLNRQIEEIQRRTFENRNIEEDEFDYTHR